MWIAIHKGTCSYHLETAFNLLLVKFYNCNCSKSKEHSNWLATPEHVCFFDYPQRHLVTWNHGLASYSLVMNAIELWYTYCQWFIRESSHFWFGLNWLENSSKIWHQLNFQQHGNRVCTWTRNRCDPGTIHILEWKRQRIVYFFKSNPVFLSYRFFDNEKQQLKMKDQWMHTLS